MTVDPSSAVSGIRIAILLMTAAIALSLSTSIGHLISFDSIALDYGVFHRVPRTDAQFLYRPGDAPFVYPPSAIAAFAPLGLVPFWPGYVLWTIVSAAVFAAAAWKLAGGRGALLSFLSAGAIEGLVLGQVSMLLSGLVLWAISLQPFRRGLLLGIVACIKPSGLQNRDSPNRFVARLGRLVPSPPDVNRNPEIAAYAMQRGGGGDSCTRQSLAQRSRAFGAIFPSVNSSCARKVMSVICAYRRDCR